MEDSNFDEVSNYLPSHFQKKNTVNHMTKENIPMRAIIFHCGWQTKIFYTIFSYIFTSLSNYIIFGKTLAHWLFKISNDIYGVVPPTLDNIQTEPEKFHLFVESLFVHKT